MHHRLNLQELGECGPRGHLTMSRPVLACLSCASVFRRSYSLVFLVVAALMLYALVPYDTRLQGGLSRGRSKTENWDPEGVWHSEKALDFLTRYCHNFSTTRAAGKSIADDERKVGVIPEAEKPFQGWRLQGEGIQTVQAQRPEKTGGFLGQYDIDKVKNERSMEDVILHLHTSDSQEVNLLSKEFQLVIKVLAYNRLESLVRCLHSLEEADYDGDAVKLHIYIDHFGLPAESLKSSIKVQPNLAEVDAAFEAKQDDYTDGALRMSFSILNHADQFKWPHGSKEVHFRTKNAGLQGQWMEAWWPSTDHEFALIVEDDMELSPLFYRYLRALIATYFYNPVNFDPSIFGISLQRPRFVAGKGGNPLLVDNSTRLFLYQMVGSWGQLLFPKPWKEFRIWYDIHKAKDIRPILEGMVTNSWYRKLGERIWTPWFIKFVHARQYYNLYTNFLQERALSVSHRDAGVNYKSKTGPDSQLIMEGIRDIDLWEMVPLKLLKRYDFCFHQIVPQDIVGSRSEKLQPLLGTVHNRSDVVLVSLLGVPESLIRNWLCHFERLGIQNYLLLGDDIALLKDLGRRGHAVMHAMLGKQEKSLLLEAETRNLASAVFLRDLLTVSSVRSVIRWGYNVLFTKADTLWFQHPLRDVDALHHDIAAVKYGQECSSGLLYIRRTKNAQRILHCIWKKLFFLWETSRLDAMNATNQANGETWGKIGCECAAEKEVSVRFLDPIWYPPFTESSADADAPVTGTTPTLVLDGLRYDPLVLVKEMHQRGFWVVDDDLACVRVTCQQTQ